MHLLLSVLFSCAGGKTLEAPPRTFAVLAINDLYRLEGIPEAGTGGLARVRSLRTALEAQYPDLLLVHAGDMLYPSLLSRQYDGEQMIDGLNRLDGDPAAQDPRMWVIFGNHEFEKGKLSAAPMLDSRIGASQFGWVNSNVRFKKGEDGQDLVADPKLVADALVESGGVKVGLFSLTADIKRADYIDTFLDPLETAKAESASLRARGAEVVIAVTHQDMAADEALLKTLGSAGPDLILGGHDHARQCAVVDGRPVYKADADGATATVLRVSVGAGGVVSTDHRYAFLGGTPSESPMVDCPTSALGMELPPPDPALVAQADDWNTRFDAVWCSEKLKLPAGCLSEQITKTNTAFNAEENTVRRFETSAGDWIADQMRAAFAAQGAQIAFVNAGTLRLNEELPAGSPILRRHVEELIGFASPLHLVKIDGAALQGIVDHSISAWTGSGHWLQVSGFAFRHDPNAGTATALTLLTAAGPKPIAPTDTLLAVVPDYLVAATGDQDGYGQWLKPAMIVADGPDLKDVLSASFAAAGQAGIAPTLEGRVCNPLAPGPCLAVAP